MKLERLLLPLALLALTTTACAAAGGNYPAPIETLQDRGVRIVDSFDAPGNLSGYTGMSGNQPIDLYVTPNGQYVIVGSMVDTRGPPLEALKKRGVRVVGSFEAPGGLTGYAGISNHQPIALYVTPDGQHVIVGSMLDSQGRFVHQDVLHRMTDELRADYIWSQLQNSNWVSEGAPDAPKTVYVFSDPNCPFCYMFWQRAQPWIDSGQVELRHIIVGVISKSSDNKAATILTADNPEHMLVKNKKLYPEGGVTPMENVPASVQRKLIANMQLMRRLGVAGTPSLLYRGEDGTIKLWSGLPPKHMMEQILGAR